MIKLSLFHCPKKLFILMNIWTIGKNLMKHHYFNKKFYTHVNMEDITDADYTHAKKVYKDFEI